jgi:NAD(P)-dependent dehydrogenase (short-subunit alcohol dehydrogenase family)
MIEQAVDTYGVLDVLVNNAGFLRDRMLANTSEDEWDAVMRVHLKGHFAPARHAIAPAARTRMTEEVFAATMAAPTEGAFDAMAPENVSPLVVWLGSVASADVTGRVFEVEGGKISVADGWQHGPEVDKGAKWNPADVGGAVAEVLAKAPAPAPVYGAS